MLGVSSRHCGSPVPRWFIRTRKKVAQIGRNVRFTSWVSIRQTGGMSIISTVWPGRHKAPPVVSTCSTFYKIRKYSAKFSDVLTSITSQISSLQQIVSGQTEMHFRLFRTKSNEGKRNDRRPAPAVFLQRSNNGGPETKDNKNKSTTHTSTTTNKNEIKFKKIFICSDRPHP